MKTTTPLTGSHQRTFDRIFQHPISHNLEWREAQHFFLNQSAVEQVDTVGGNEECFRLGWLAREKAGRDEESLPEGPVEPLSHDEINRNRESDLVDAHFTVTARKATEANEGGLTDPKVP